MAKGVIRCAGLSSALSFLSLSYSLFSDAYFFYQFYFTQLVNTQLVHSNLLEYQKSCCAKHQPVLMYHDPLASHHHDEVNSCRYQLYCHRSFNFEFVIYLQVHVLTSLDIFKFELYEPKLLLCMHIKGWINQVRQLSDQSFANL